ncbi:hypothetical protein ACFU7Y_29385 [Kitasatospora sp. NPDC057542]|uniref:hypothetical protein n=1 Tax=Kitasatospora sp. NPDC057542 TaxID=3346162 RepID=UPI0036AABD13
MTRGRRQRRPGADAVEPAEPSRPGRTAYRRGSANPNGSTTAPRSDVLGALGVLKVATADQLQRLLRPSAASNKAIRQALGDLALHGLVASDGNTKDRHKTWRLEGTGGPRPARPPPAVRSAAAPGRRRACQGRRPGRRRPGGCRAPASAAASPPGHRVAVRLAPATSRPARAGAVALATVRLASLGVAAAAVRLVPACSPGRAAAVRSGGPAHTVEA